MKKIFNILKLVVYFLIILFVIFFSIMNSDFVKINFDFFPFSYILEIRLFLLIIFCFSFGFLCGILASSYALIKRYFENYLQKRKVKKLENDIKNLDKKATTNEGN